jgi:hypothetical protein
MQSTSHMMKQKRMLLRETHQVNGTATPVMGTTDSEGVPTGQTQLNLEADPAATKAPTVIGEGENRIPDNPVAEFLRVHHNSGHAPSLRLQEMAKGIIIQKVQASCNIPDYSAHQYCTATKRNWRPNTARQNMSLPGQQSQGKWFQQTKWTPKNQDSFLKLLDSSPRRGTDEQQPLQITSPDAGPCTCRDTHQLRRFPN